MVPPIDNKTNYMVLNDDSLKLFAKFDGKKCLKLHDIYFKKIDFMPWTNF